MVTNDKMLTVKLPSDLHEAVMAKAKEKSRISGTEFSVSAMVRDSLEAWAARPARDPGASPPKDCDHPLEFRGTGAFANVCSTGKGGCGTKL